MRHVPNTTRLLPGLLAWLGMGISLAIAQHLLWQGVWSMTLIVWWTYLILTVVMLLRLLILTRFAPSRRGAPVLLWTMLSLALMLWWWRPLWTTAGTDLMDGLRAPTVEPTELATGGGRV